ncbi:hypothetical protein TrVE_jg3078 [Triparma verrucosa]|jgi:GTPase SAR1 family protein|uniref:Uncharacterized protein n=1 Tax=Triparma verrucosa TaxID=1606542 RepID=A0A9W7EK79_9STRA|nr:hypothetical protein TrVE_jg3078 [Triparma verrucosa]|eukprot:CAMPEP_0182500016 /NCGR_PEP_ID=MMETSP1321-20130603/8070_1 /TAXON_ID=91990 /ORGANISM="Bolidomonas sp., Strain RCC1657" /LENGTH=358 /DNA_ID=CAMNT_0024704277 /DNA_START=36 /DNA_END=1112 /DNA_ORIENTATION=+
MGACNSVSAAERDAMARSMEVERLNEEAWMKEQEKIKLLLLGAGESGKSTIFKQMKVLYGKPLDDEERRQMTPVVYSNTISAMKILVDQTLNYAFEGDVAAKDAFTKIKHSSDTQEIDEETGNAVKALWADPGIQKTWEKRSDFQIVESMKYYFENIDRIKQPNYLANQQDILLSRVRTSGIVTERYEIDGSQFEMYDVGGQRNERKKWIHCFDDVTAVIFVAALSEYDQRLFEDANTNRMVEAIDLFDEIANNRYFRESSMILFLNKRDLFEGKIERVDIATVDAFSDFVKKDPSQSNYDAGIAYFLGKFLARSKTEEKIVYHHITCATDTENVEVVFNACKDIILRDNLKDSGFMD